jgi:hypothetical protein
MNKFWLVALAVISQPKSGSGQMAHFVSADGQTKMSFGPNCLVKTISPSEAQMTLSGGVQISLLKQATQISARRAIALIETKNKTSRFKSVHAVDAVKIVKRTKGSRMSSISSSIADYREGPGNPEAFFSGAVHLQDVDGATHTVVNAVGQDGRAVFMSGLGSKSSGILEATLKGSVVVKVDQISLGGKTPGHVEIRCNQVTYTPGKSGARLEFTGDVRMRGTGGLISGSMNDAQHVTFHLNAHNEMTDFSSGNAP